MAIGTQLVKIRRTSDGQEIYQATTTRDTDVYPLTSAGQAAFEAAASAGGFTLMLDNGAVVAAGTRPPLTKPGSSANPPFFRKLQAEDATGTGAFTEQSGDNNLRGPYTSSSDYLLYAITDVPVTASNYTLTIRYQTNSQTPGLATIIVNSGSSIDFPLEGTDGGKRMYNLPIQLNAGSNRIRIQGKSGTSFYQDYIIVTRPIS
ncbi:carbohydrate-binding protein [Spirosoma gilvum]